MIQLSNLEVSYGLIRAVKEVSLTVGKGELVALIGANGAGKTSVLRAIMGLTRAQGGTIGFGEEAVRIDGRPPHQIARLGIGYVPEGRAILAEMTVLENLEVSRAAAAGRGKLTFAAQLEGILGRFPALERRLHNPASVLSGGERQMLAIARALIGQPKLLLLDEPSLGLAPLVVNDVYEIVRGLNAEGIAVLVVEQNAQKALKLAGRAYVMEQGSIVFQGPSREILQDQNLREAYLGG